MSKSVEQLIITLEKEREVYQDVLEISQKKRASIKEQRISDLEKFVSEEQGLVVTLFKLEEIREKVVDLVMREHNLEFVENVTQLAQFLDPNEKKLVLEAKNNLVVLVKNVADENKFNSKLIEEKLNMINFNLDLLTQVSDESGQYNKKAITDDSERKNIFDARI
ncbi:flagellar protein FlgN [Fusibacter sp. 3D3]|uniref:flagellar protein FlgN n=1 Tax=Fusibacter sp. 3D3 TaxID=1048380 RepID=UPI000853B2C0|nr:flagellar protein FlgN [Fusibacter sp. 3D3]GAU75674.1 hypothetical protein F3D3_0265 [Fusibacter sp. 3D3]